jgi:hypothetical protein
MIHRVTFLALAFAIGCSTTDTGGAGGEGNDASAGAAASGATGGSGGVAAGADGATAGSGGTAASAGSGGTPDASEEPGTDASTDTSAVPDAIADSPENPDASEDSADLANPDSGLPPRWMGPVNFTFDDVDAGASGWYSLLGPPPTVLTVNTEQGHPTPPSLQFTIPFDALAQQAGASVGLGLSPDAGARDFTNSKALHAWVKRGTGSSLGDVVLFVQTQGPAGPFAWNGVAIASSDLQDGAWHELVFKLPDDIRPGNDIGIVNQIGVQVGNATSGDAGVPGTAVIYVDDVWLE